MKKLILTVLAISLFACSKEDTTSTIPTPENFVVSNFVGSTLGDINGTGANVQLNFPRGLVKDVSGNFYLADYASHKIKKITPQGEVTTFAGSILGDLDGTGTAARFYHPIAIAIDASGNLYVSSHYSHKIKKITPAGVVTTLAGSTGGDAEGTGSFAKFNYPSGIAVDASGNVFVSDQNNHKIKKITPAGVVTTFVGSSQGYADGTGTNAQFNVPIGLTIDKAGNLYCCDRSNNKIRKITPSGVVTTIAGSTQGDLDGTGSSAKLNGPRSLTIDSSGNLYVTDDYNHKIKKITRSGEVTTLAGSTQGDVVGNGLSSQFYNPDGIAVNSLGELYVCDTYNHKIKKLTK